MLFRSKLPKTFEITADPEDVIVNIIELREEEVEEEVEEEAEEGAEGEKKDAEGDKAEKSAEGGKDDKDQDRK